MGATYCPEDDKLRLYCGRVPRDEYERLRAEGWVSTPKQSEAGKGEFAAVWTVARYQTALAYADDGIIDDEDAGPQERAADRAERFGAYRDKRTEEATAAADRYDAAPHVHGFQNQARADRAAARVDRIAGRACDAWSKAEYWTRRTAGVISNALYKATPAVRMGRIKEIESDLRRQEAYSGEISESRQLLIDHLRLRLAYENQMLEAAGGRAGVLEMVPGGLLRGAVIWKVNKSSVTGRVTSCDVIVPKVEGWAYRISTPAAGVSFSVMSVKTERLAPEAYKEPTPESLARLADCRSEVKAWRAGKPAPLPLINPTDADAERLQAFWNERARAAHCESNFRRYGKDYAEQFKPAAVLRMTQAQYSAASGGTYSYCKTYDIRQGGAVKREHEDCHKYGEEFRQAQAKRGPTVCKLRLASCESDVKRVIILTDKPAKALPESVWHKHQPAAPVVSPAVAAVPAADLFAAVEGGAR